MALGAAFKARGHQEVGHVGAGPADVSWGKTSEDGVEVQMQVTAVDLFSSQSLMEEDTGISRVSMSLAMNLIHSELSVIADAFGIPAASLTGDGATTPETLAIGQADLGAEERALYSLGPGPNSTRRINAPRAKVADLGNLVQSKTNWMQPAPTWRVLEPVGGGAVVTIIDAL